MWSQCLIVSLPHSLTIFDKIHMVEIRAAFGIPLRFGILVSYSLDVHFIQFHLGNLLWIIKRAYSYYKHIMLFFMLRFCRRSAPIIWEREPGEG